jgi:hypothetical protein
MKHARADYQRIQDPAGLIGEDEPVFLLRAKDKLAPDTVRAWARLMWKEAKGDDPRFEERLDMARAAWHNADLMDEWQRDHGTQVPDMPAPDDQLGGLD